MTVTPATPTPKRSHLFHSGVVRLMDSSVLGAGGLIQRELAVVESVALFTLVAELHGTIGLSLKLVKIIPLPC